MSRPTTSILTIKFSTHAPSLESQNSEILPSQQPTSSQGYNADDEFESSQESQNSDNRDSPQIMRIPLCRTDSSSSEDQSDSEYGSSSTEEEPSESSKSETQDSNDDSDLATECDDDDSLSSSFEEPPASFPSTLTAFGDCESSSSSDGL